MLAVCCCVISFLSSLALRPSRPSNPIMPQRNQQYAKEYPIMRFHGFFMDDSVGVAKNPNARFPISLASECEMSPMMKSIGYTQS